MNLEQIKVIAKLDEARASLRAALGDKYLATIKPYVDEIERQAREDGVPVLRVASGAARRATEGGDGLAAVYILAAAVESIDPTKRMSTPEGGR